MERKSKSRKLWVMGIDNWNIKSFVLSIVKLHTITATTTDLGNWLNLKNGFVFGMFKQIRRFGFLTPKPTVVPERWQ
ncbi:hypothetical protein [Flavobacterium sp. A45]|uniref:hypothetical protein n=1 Tax=Flavobacterium sp. A45 TaxID=1945862 RepID=UPI000F4D5856|nr:hypothetical protein [Flavobacterium sp. A45]